MRNYGLPVIPEELITTSGFSLSHHYPMVPAPNVSSLSDCWQDIYEDISLYNKKCLTKFVSITHKYLLHHSKL